MSAEVRTGKSIVTDQYITRPTDGRVSRRRASFEAIHAKLGISQPDSRLGSFVQPGDEFLFFLNTGRKRWRTPPIMGTGVILREQEQEGDVVFSGAIKVPILGKPEAPAGVREGTFQIEPSTVRELSANDPSNIPLAARGAANLIATRVFHLDPLDTELDTTYEEFQSEVTPITWVHFHELKFP